ncbi:hypothetical protein RIF29_09407 [Crotalaria pallida]|uniref:Uncharacterized protein n=1 Tax=Crotalaria pallida TaxID=3830 RepID=A0AAN9IHW5_CROPI
MEVDTEPQTPADVSMEEDTDDLPPVEYQVSTLPVTVDTVDALGNLLPFTVTSNSITAAGRWSLVPGSQQFYGLVLPDRLALPTNFTIATNTFVILVTVQADGETYFNVTPTLNENTEEHDKHELRIDTTLPIAMFPIALTLCLADVNTNTSIAFVIRFLTNKIAFATETMPLNTPFAAFLRMRPV